MAENNSITVESITLSDLLKKKLTVPEYQRPYVWEKENIDKLLTQIKNHKENKGDSNPLFYMGSVVLHEDEQENLNIIDGQQRITTFALITHIQKKKAIEIHYENLVSQQRIKENYYYLSSISDNLNNINFDEINVTTVTTKSQDEAYNFFETLNTGGVRLTGTQIIKAHHLRSIPVADVAMYGISWEKEEAHIEDVIKLLLKARIWNVLLNFGYVPSRHANTNDWKKIITKEFSERTINSSADDAFSIWKNNDCTYEQIGNVYAIRQPLSNGKNFVNYLFSFIKIYKQLFVFDSDNKRTEGYKKFTKEIINVIDGTIDLKALYQLALICYVSKFGFQKIDIAFFWIFRFVYSLRVSNTRVMEATVINHNKSNMVIDRILNAFSEEEIFDWLKQYPYKPNYENTNEVNGVKGRFVKRVLGENSFTNENLDKYDELLKQKLNEQ